MVVIGGSATLVAVAWLTTEHHLHDEEHTGLTHVVTIDRPHRHESLERPPVIVCLDGAWTTGTIRDATRSMSMSREAPEAVVVGVWFDEPSMGAYLRARAQYYTPTGWVPPPETGVRDVTATDTGKADAYRAFLREQVLPLVDSEIPVGERWLFGHSFSGLFGLHTLFNEPALFDRYLLASPSIWWHDRSILDAEQAWAEANADLPAAVFLSSGGIESSTEFNDDRFRMGGNVDDLCERLVGRGYPGLSLTRAMLAGESHNSTVGAAVSVGLRALFAPSGLVLADETSTTSVTVRSP